MAKQRPAAWPRRRTSIPRPPSALSAAELHDIAGRLYRELTGRVVTVPVVWNSRLRTSGGRFVVPTPERRTSDERRPRIELNPRYVDAGGLDVLLDVMKHELAHYHLWVTGQSWGHTREFRHLMKQWGFQRHVDASLLPKPADQWEYACLVCGHAIRRTRRLKRPVSCARCSSRYNPKFRLVENRIG